MLERSSGIDWPAVSLSARSFDPMRVLIFTSMYPGKDSPGYAPYMADQVRSLIEAGLSIKLIEVNPRSTRFNYAVVFPQLVRSIRSKEFDIIHTHHTYTMLLVDFARRIARVRIPVVLTNHEGETLDLVRSLRTWHPTSRLRHSLFLKRLAAERADFVIFVSRRLSEMIAPSVPFEVIPCGVDLSKFTPLDRALCRRQLSIGSGATVLFFPNNPRGAGKRFALAQATYEIVKKRVQPSFLLAADGNIPHHMMPLYYNAADVVIQASFYEASPTVVKETLACEVPLVSTDSGDTREIVDGVPYCFVCRADARDLAEHALLCLGQRAVGGRDRLRAMELGTDQVARRLLRVYRRAVGEGMASKKANQS